MYTEETIMQLTRKKLREACTVMKVAWSPIGLTNATIRSKLVEHLKNPPPPSETPEPQKHPRSAKRPLTMSHSLPPGVFGPPRKRRRHAASPQASTAMRSPLSSPAVKGLRRRTTVINFTPVRGNRLNQLESSVNSVSRSSVSRCQPPRRVRLSDESSCGGRIREPARPPPPVKLETCQGECHSFTPALDTHCCAICLQDTPLHVNMSWMTMGHDSGHKFHGECWYHNVLSKKSSFVPCPLCRAPVSTMNPEQEDDERLQAEAGAGGVMNVLLNDPESDYESDSEDRWFFASDDSDMLTFDENPGQGNGGNEDDLIRAFLTNPNRSPAGRRPSLASLPNPIGRAAQ